MYGVEFLREFDSRDPEHLSRKERLCELPSGPKLLPDAFDCILARVNGLFTCALGPRPLTTYTYSQSAKVKESTVFSRKYCTELTSLVSQILYPISFLSDLASAEYTLRFRSRDLVLQGWRHRTPVDP